ncbi:MAG: hypothetical protein NXY57DRAFT_280196 [Lentinula lateritia]|nr:MAG: hypothetical protein NXY57DRAFT_280196 [Lentinula lateritia]
MTKQLWLKTSTIYQEFTDVELTAVGVIPDTATNPEAETFVMDWPIAQGNLRSLQDLVAVQGVSNKGFFVSAPNSTESIGYRFKHRLFEELDPSVEVADEDDRKILTDWPRKNDAVATALDKLLAQNPLKYRLYPLQAYDYHCEPIDALWYRKYLENAVVEVRFTLSHWPISGKSNGGGANVFRANIVDILVLCTPPPVVVSPRKRKESDLTL